MGALDYMRYQALIDKPEIGRGFNPLLDRPEIEQGLLGSYKKGDRLDSYRQGGGLLDVLAETELGQGLLGLATDPVGQTKKAVSTVANKVREANRKNKEAFESGNNDLIASRALDYSQDALGFAPIGMTVWHGSPHKFDKFDMSKIGTGEGAQAYGHGLYTAENRMVGEEYRRALTGGGHMVPDVNYKGDYFRSGQLSGTQAEAVGLVAEALRKDIPVTDAIQKAQEIAKKRFAADVKNVRSAGMGADEYLQSPEQYKELLREIKSVNPADIQRVGDPREAGYLYKVDIPDEAVARFLDWDKPLSQQAPEVQRALKTVVDSKHGAGTWDEWVKGSPDYRDFRNDLMETVSEDVISNQLRQQGIPGIRYLDGGSRSAGQGSSNFVLFSDDLPRILEINGQATGNQPWARGEWGGLLDTPVSKEGPRAEAMRIAQANAAKPVSEGGLGLRPDNTPMERAKAMGFDTPVYHGTTGDITEFDVMKRGTKSDSGWYGDADYTTPNPDFASKFAEAPNDGLGAIAYQEGGNVMPLLANAKNSYDWRANEPMGRGLFQNDRAASIEKRHELQRLGYDSVAVNNSRVHLPDGQTLTDEQWGALTGSSPLLKVIGKSKVEDLIRKNNYDFRTFSDAYGHDAAKAMPLHDEMVELATFNPNQLRSRFAAFDPARRHEADLLGFADPRLLALIAAGTGGGLLAQD